MEHLTNAIKRVESGRLAKAAQGLADHTLTVNGLPSTRQPCARPRVITSDNLVLCQPWPR